MYFRHTLTPLICLLFNNGHVISPFYSKFKKLKQKQKRQSSLPKITQLGDTGSEFISMFLN